MIPRVGSLIPQFDADYWNHAVHVLYHSKIGVFTRKELEEWGWCYYDYHKYKVCLLCPGILAGTKLWVQGTHFRKVTNTYTRSSLYHITKYFTLLAQICKFTYNLSTLTSHWFNHIKPTTSNPPKQQACKFSLLFLVIYGCKTQKVQSWMLNASLAKCWWVSTDNKTNSTSNAGHLHFEKTSSSCWIAQVSLLIHAINVGWWCKFWMPLFSLYDYLQHLYDASHIYKISD